MAEEQNGYITAIKNTFACSVAQGGATAGLRNMFSSTVEEITGSSVISVLSGVQEAKYEFFAINLDDAVAGATFADASSLKDIWKRKVADGSLKNFISTGGASAQLAVKFADFNSGLDKQADFDNMLKELAKYLPTQLKNGKITKPKANFYCQQGTEERQYPFHANEFVSVLSFDGNGMMYESERVFNDELVQQDEEPTFTYKCNPKKHVCFALFSFLAGLSADAEKKCIQPSQKGSIPQHNLMGGAKEVYFNYLNWHVNGKKAYKESALETSWSADGKAGSGQFAGRFLLRKYGLARDTLDWADDANSFVEDLATQTEQHMDDLKEFLANDKFFVQVADFVKTTGETVFYAGGAFANYPVESFMSAGALGKLMLCNGQNTNGITFKKSGTQVALVTGVNCKNAFGWGLMFMTVYRDFLGATTLKQAPNTKGDWPFGMAFEAIKEGGLAKCNFINTIGAVVEDDVCKKPLTATLLMLENEISSLY